MTRLKVSAAHAAPARPLLLIDAGNTRIKWAWIAGGADAEPALPEEPGGTPWQHAGARAHDRFVCLDGQPPVQRLGRAYAVVIAFASDLEFVPLSRKQRAHFVGA